ncbi:uncharacterized protein LOC125145582, partial [Tachysurus ichikawai]
MVWSIVEGSGSNGQVVGLQDWMSCKISSAATVEKCDNEEGSLGRSQDLKDLKDSDDFSGDFLDKSLIQFTCLEILERELQDVVHLWNTHRIRPSRNAVSPCGRPVMMYTLPQLFGAREYLKEASQQKIQACREEWRKERGPYPCDNTVFDICCLAMAENSLHPPTSPEEAIDLYMFLRAYTRTQI